MQHRVNTARDRRCEQDERGRRAAARALSDTALLDAMTSGDHWAWYEFDARFRLRLERFAEMVGIPSADWPECIDEVLEDTAMRWTTPGIARPDSLIRYLVRAVRNRAMNLGRGRRDGLMVSMRARELAASPAADASSTSAALTRLIEKVRDSLSEDEELLLGWVGAGVPHRQIAAWLEISYDAAAKRVARLSGRLRERLAATADEEDDDTRAMIARFLSGRGEVRR